MANKDLVVKMTINSKDFETGLKNANSSIKKTEVSIGSLTKSFAKFAGGLGLAVSAGSLFFGNLKDIETISDKVAKTQKVLNESIKSVFTSINTNSFKGFIDGLNDVVKNAKNAYDALDNLGTYLNFSSVEAARNQARQSEARYMIAAIKKGEIEGDVKYWEDQLRKLQSEAEGIISREIKHYEDAIAASNQLLFSKFKGNEERLQRFMDLYTGTADKNEAANNRYNYLVEQRDEIIRLFGKYTNPNTAKNSMYMDFMKQYGDELEFLEIIVKREKDLSEINRLLIAQENRKTQLYGERRANLRYLSGEDGGGSPTSLSTPTSTPTASPALQMSLDQQMQYLAMALQNEILNDDRIKDAMVIDFEIPEEEIEDDAAVIEEAVRRAREEMELMAITTQQAFTAADQLAGAFLNMGKIADGTLGNVFTMMGSVIQQVVQTMQAMMTLAGAETIEGIADVFANTPGGVYTKLAVSAAALSGILGIIATAKSSFAGSFAQGGIVGGNSYTGDNLWARVNSGEMIIPYNDWHNSNAAGNVHFVIEGSQLKGVLDNYDKTVSL